MTLLGIEPQLATVLRRQTLYPLSNLISTGRSQQGLSHAQHFKEEFKAISTVICQDFFLLSCRDMGTGALLSSPQFF